MVRSRLLLIFALAAPAMAGPPSPDERYEPLEIKGWGKAIDPDGDCKFSIEGGRVSIAVPGKVHALSAELGRMNAPRLLREVEGDFIAQVKVGGVCPTGPSSDVPGRHPFRGAGLLLWQDEGNYIRLERARMEIRGKDLNYGNFESRGGNRFERAGNTAERPLDGEESHLRLERRGGTVIASVSPDGIRWTTLEPLKVDLPGKVQVGIAAINNTPTPFEPRFEGFRVLR